MNPITGWIGALLRAVGISDKPQKMLWPIPEPTPTPIPTPTPTPTPQPKGQVLGAATQAFGRNPRIEEFSKKDPKSYQEISSGVQLATDDPLRRSLLMDIALEESGLRVNPPANPLSSAKGSYQYIDSTSKMMGIDPLSATESAKATNKLLDRKLLHWWETLTKGGATKTPLSDLYSQEELNQFLLPKYQL